MLYAFRVQNATLFQESFVKVLEYTREMGVAAKRGGGEAFQWCRGSASCVIGQIKVFCASIRAKKGIHPQM